jgi:TatD DNase family protein
MVKNMLSYTDTHAHLSLLSRRGIDAAPLLSELEAGGFGSILDVGTESDDLRGRIEAFGGFPFVRFSAGIWPGEDAIRNRESRLSALRRSISEAGPGRLVAIGECGIDRHWNRPDQGADAEGELELFMAQAQLALELDLPVIVHSGMPPPETALGDRGSPGVRGVILHASRTEPRRRGAFLRLPDSSFPSRGPSPNAHIRPSGGGPLRARRPAVPG